MKHIFDLHLILNSHYFHSLNTANVKAANVLFLLSCFVDEFYVAIVRLVFKCFQRISFSERIENKPWTFRPKFDLRM